MIFSDHELYKKVISGVNDKRSSQNTSEFTIPNLMTNEEWESYSDQSKRNVKKRFKEKVDCSEIPKVVFCYKNEAKWDVYQIIL